MDALLKRLFALSASSEMKLNLEIPLLLSELFDFPERSFPKIHVAGTNGKGSVVTKIAKALELSGLKVGRYTSPHLTSFRERIQVNGEWISEEFISKRMKVVFKKVDQKKIPTTFFELTTLLAFDYFREMKVDVAVIETGLGGRLDATNIIDPILTVITSISLDHAHILGSTLEEIASEKAGILKPHIPVVLGPRAVLAPIVNRAKELGCPVKVAAKVANFYDEENRIIARTALDLLKERFTLTQEVIDQGLNFRPSCRFEKRGDLIFDVAHNPDGFDRLFEALFRFFPKKALIVLVGMAKDKDYGECLEKIAERAELIYLVQAQGDRAAATQDLAAVLQKKGYSSFVCGKDVSSTALLAAEEAKRRGALLLVCGSFFIMEDARKALLGADSTPADLFESGVVACDLL